MFPSGELSKTSRVVDTAMAAPRARYGDGQGCV